jgi:hypothetical protein
MRTGFRRAGAASGAALVCLLVALVVLGAGYGVQRVALRAPTAGEKLTARSVGVLLRYRYVESEFRVAGQPPLTARCLQGWMPGRSGRPSGRGARLVLSDGERLLSGDRRIVRLSRGTTKTPLSPVAELQLAGCPRPLSDHLSARLIGGKRAQAVPATFDGKPALRMHVRTLRTRFDLYVDRHTLLPLGVRVSANGVTGVSRVRPLTLTPSAKRNFLERFNGG